ncbi:MAG: hypothetical protein Q8J64_10170 [Thermodesulfovibrionales bacterium]|nr:hypothetical protein [Thermodesulfovibrionales bacterium]
MKAASSKISCTTFQKQRLEFKSLTEKIGKAKQAEKTKCAKGLKREAEALLGCGKYSEAETCRDCRTVAEVYRTLANSVVRQTGLSDSGAQEELWLNR